MRILALVTEAFGGHGGIALYNRDLLTALCAYPPCSEVVAIPRLMSRAPEPLPAKLRYVIKGIGGKGIYTTTVLRMIRNGPFDLIVCGHLNLLPLASLLGFWLRAPTLLEIYGIDAWYPGALRFPNALVNRIDAFVSISEVTKERFLTWARPNRAQRFVLPNAIHAHLYTPAPKNPGLLERYGLKGKRVLMTLGRLSADERYKGVDEILELLPALARQFPNIAYLIVGDGDDRPRLEAKAGDLNIGDRVVFTGYVLENEKADHYRLADVFAMPSRGEGFGFVFLEAMACGIPVIAGALDGGREALRGGELGLLVDPAKPNEVAEAIVTALDRPKGIPVGLNYFSYENFSKRVHAMVDEIMNRSGPET